ncbi:SURP and G-patch domain-containing protein 1-like protein [Iris pallida]|uniref:SURP and G-patch domain-containing protein 1-like protein n=2 Tax=Iris pallida TaxID=29817 RepID=A0AAX6HXI3_IRIPA|nr:SURP and G-patch domain-containing protein 1-like protein [Iris pallida]
MEKGAKPSLFVNDGSFMERFRQLQQEKQDKGVPTEEPKPGVSSDASGPLKPGVFGSKRPLDTKSNDNKKPNSVVSNGKLAFSLKQKSKAVIPAVKLGEDEEEETGVQEPRTGDESAKRKKLGPLDVSGPPSKLGDVAPFPPRDPSVKNVADKLASFVAKNGRQFEHVTRQRNPGDTPFKFLFNSDCSDYKYYEYRLLEEEKFLAQAQVSQAPHPPVSNTATSRSSNFSPVTPLQQHSNYQTPASALYDANEETRSYPTSGGESSGPPVNDPLAMMEYYMKKAAQEERRKPPKQSKDEMPPPASLQASSKKGHHMGDYIPQEELEKFLATCNDVHAQKAAQEAAEKAKIQADNIGHKLLSKMGWKEGEGLGSGKSGRADPVMAGNVKRDNLGVGAAQPGEVTPDDDIYEQYKKRMMLGYRYRPNPLGNPRKSYY